MPRLIALVRGINVGSTRKLPMAELRAACADTGLGIVRTYIQSGNLVLDEGDPAAAEATLEALIADRFGLAVPVIARTAAQWNTLVASCPLPDAAREAPKSFHLLLCKRPPAGGAIEALRARARHDEIILPWGTDIAIHFTQSVADSKLAPTLIDRLVGAPATGRNWNTVVKLQEMAGG